LTAATGSFTIPNMKVVELTNVVRRDSPVLYRRAYTATALLAYDGVEPLSVPIEFVLEHSPLGQVDVRVTLLDAVDAPPDTAAHALRDEVARLEKDGALP